MNKKFAEEWKELKAKQEKRKARAGSQVGATPRISYGNNSLATRQASRHKLQQFRFKGAPISSLWVRLCVLFLRFYFAFCRKY